MLLYVRLGSVLVAVVGALLCGVGVLRASAGQEEWFRTLDGWKDRSGFVVRHFATPDEESAKIDYAEEMDAGGNVRRIVLSATVDGSGGRTFRRITEVSTDASVDPVVRYEGPPGFRGPWVVAGVVVGVIGVGVLVGRLFVGRKPAANV